MVIFLDFCSRTLSTILLKILEENFNDFAKYFEFNQ